MNVLLHKFEENDFSDIDKAFVKTKTTEFYKTIGEYLEQWTVFAKV